MERHSPWNGQHANLPAQHQAGQDGRLHRVCDVATDQELVDRSDRAFHELPGEHDVVEGIHGLVIEEHRTVRPELGEMAAHLARLRAVDLRGGTTAGEDDRVEMNTIKTARDPLDVRTEVRVEVIAADDGNGHRAL